MLSWRLWHMLTERSPDARFVRLLPPKRNVHRNRNRALFAVTTLVGMPISCILCVGVVYVLDRSSGLLTLVPYLLSLLLHLILFGWTLGLGRVMSVPRTRGLSDLLALIPVGAIGSSWLLAHAWIGQSKRLDSVLAGLQIVLAIIGVLSFPLMTIGLDSLFDARGIESFGFFGAVLAEIGLLILLYVDFAQGSVLAIVLGVVSTTLAWESALTTAALFTALEVCLYLSMAVIMMLLPGLFDALSVPAVLEVMLIVMAQAVVLLGGRELIIAALVYRLRHRAGDDPFVYPSLKG